jgi:hypothetical protein
MKRLKQICTKVILPGLVALGLSMWMAAPVWCQTDNTPSQQPVAAQVGLDNGPTPDNSENNDASNSGDRMLTPPPVSGQTYPTVPTSQERSNYLRAGLTFASAYSDNVLGSVEGHPVSDVSYSVAPTVALDATTTRERLLLTYAPGFTFYQRTSARNEADQNAAITFQYRLSPHVTFSARDSFQKSSTVFNQPDLESAGAVYGGAQSPNFSVIAPIADRLANSGNAGLGYQFSLNSMIGASGTFSNLHYPNPAQVPGLYDSSSQGGAAFYALRISKVHYFGATYQYQRLVAYPTAGLSETQTHEVFLFYTVYPTSRFSISFFGGPQYSDTIQPALPPLQPQLLPARAWSPAGGASLSWQGRLNSFAMSYLHIISGGGGLIGAVHMDSATGSVRKQITRTFSASVAGGYVQNDLLASLLPGTANGHSVSGTASLQQQFGQHLSVQLGYMRLRQDYSNVSVLALTPDTNREFVSLSYQFARPMGR